MEKNEDSGFTLIQLMIVTVIVLGFIVFGVMEFRKMAPKVLLGRWREISATVEPFRLAISECAQKKEMFDQCDTMSKLMSSTGYATFPSADALLKGVKINAKTAALVVTGTENAKNCVVTWTPHFDGAKKTVWNARTSGADCTKEQTGFDDSSTGSAGS